MPHDDHEKNRLAWNDMVEVHYRHPRYRVREFLEGECSLNSIETDALGDVTGKSLLHLMCQFGQDTLSWARRGAEVTGVDISDRSIEYANALASEARLPARFVRSDVLDLPDVLEGEFDVVFQSYGTLCWLADLRRWASVVARYVRPGGVFLLIDDHPILSLYESDPAPYFHDKPLRYAGERDYCDRDFIVEKERVEHQHPLSEIINAVIDAGLTIERVDEYDKGYYPIQDDWFKKDGYWYPPGGSPDYPLMFSLKACKK